MTNATSTEGQIDSRKLQTLNLEEFDIPCYNVLKKISTKHESEQVATDLDKLVEHPNAKENLEKVKEFHAMLKCFLEDLKKYDNSNFNTILEENAVKKAVRWLHDITTPETTTPDTTTPD